MQIKLGTKNTGARFPIARNTDRHGTWEQQKMEKKRRFQNIWKLSLQNRANNNQKWTISRYTKKKVQIKHLIKSRNSKYLTNESRPLYTKAFGIRSREKSPFPKRSKILCMYIYIYLYIHLSIYIIYIMQMDIYIYILNSNIYICSSRKSGINGKKQLQNFKTISPQKKHIEEQCNSQTWGITQGRWARDKIFKT